jgi:uncharacterized protein YeaO (DUF488 family)
VLGAPRRPALPRCARATRRPKLAGRRQQERAMAIFLKRAYDPPTASDGKRILVDRLWPRGLAKVKAKFDVWLKDVAPSTELREWFGHDPAKWTEFQTRYRAELKGNPAFDELKKLAHQGNITLIYAARDQVHNEAVVLQQLLEHGH